MTQHGRAAPRGGLRRAALVIGCLGFGAAALGSGLDRMAATRPALAPLVPAVFASEALRTSGRLLLDGGNGRAAATIGIEAIKDAPVDPVSTALLGAGRLAQGDADGADAAFRVAGKLGWRVPYTQLYWLGRALDSGEVGVAALRLDALLRQNPALLRNRAVMTLLEDRADGRAAMTARLLGRPNWLLAYAADVYDQPLPIMRQRAEVLGAVSKGGTVIGCAAIAPATGQLVKLGDPLVASALWRAHCPSAGGAAIADPHFSATSLEGPASPFAWSLVGDSDISLGLGQPDAQGARSLAISSTSERDKVVASQLLVAPPGGYVLSWRGADVAEGAADQLRVSLGCLQGDRDWLQSTYDRAARRWIAPVVLGGDCAAHWLNLGITARGEAAITDIRLDRR